MTKSAPAISVGLILLLAAFATVSEADPVRAAGSNPAVNVEITAAPASLCVGNSSPVVVSYYWDYSKALLAPLVPPGKRVGVMVISAITGSFNKTSQAVDFGPKTAQFVYTAKKVGEDKIGASVMYADNTDYIGNSEPVTIDVIDCNYQFSFVANVRETTPNGWSENIFTGNGSLKLADDGTLPATTIPTHWAFMVLEESKGMTCSLKPMLKIDSTLTITGNRGQGGVWQKYGQGKANILHLEFKFAPMTFPTATLDCTPKPKIPILVNIPTTDPGSVLRTEWEPSADAPDQVEDEYGDVGTVRFYIKPVSGTSP